MQHHKLGAFVAAKPESYRWQRERLCRSKFAKEPVMAGRLIVNPFPASGEYYLSMNLF